MVDKKELDAELLDIFGSPDPEKVSIPKTNSPVVIEPTEVIVDNEEEQDLLTQKDFNYARGKLKEIVDIGKTSLEQLVTIAEQSQDPRVYRVIGELIRSTSESVRDIVDMHSKLKQMNKEETVNKTKVTNNLIMTTESLIELIKKNK